MFLIVVTAIVIIFKAYNVSLYKLNGIISVNKLIISCILIGLFLQFNLIISNNNLDRLFLDSIAILKILVLISTLVVLTFAGNQPLLIEEFSIIVLIFLVGTFSVLSSQDLISLYLGIELQSISVYILSCLGKNSAFSAEISLKYFVIGALGSVLFLFGCSLVYGATGTVSFQELPILFTGMEELPLATFGSFFILASILLKLAAVPFHVGSPDINEGASSIATAFFSIVAKIGLVVVLARFFGEVFYNSPFLTYWWTVAGLSCGIGSIYLGSIAALKQNRIKRLLAYSTISHVGYLLVGVFSGGTGIQAVFFYLIAYILASTCVWGSLLVIRRIKFISELKNIYLINPFLCFNIMLGILSLTGVPPLLGFLAKLFILVPVTQFNLFFVGIFIVFLSLCSTFYYLNLVKVIFFEKKTVWDSRTSINYSSKSSFIIIVTGSAGLILFFVFPEPLILVCCCSSKLYFLDLLDFLYQVNLKNISIQIS